MGIQQEAQTNLVFLKWKQYLTTAGIYLRWLVSSIQVFQREETLKWNFHPSNLDYKIFMRDLVNQWLTLMVEIQVKRVIMYQVLKLSAL
jgi:hypothetical protein